MSWPTIMGTVFSVLLFGTVALAYVGHAHVRRMERLGREVDEEHRPSDPAPARPSLGVVFSVQSTASFYGEEHRGGIMANGERFVPERLTCAAPADVPLGAELIVTSVREPWRTVIVRVTDRLGEAARRHGRELDLSEAAFERIAHLNEGLAGVRRRRLGPPASAPVELRRGKEATP